MNKKIFVAGWDGFAKKKIWGSAKDKNLWCFNSLVVAVYSDLNAKKQMVQCAFHWEINRETQAINIILYGTVKRCRPRQNVRSQKTFWMIFCKTLKNPLIILLSLRVELKTSRLLNGCSNQLSYESSTCSKLLLILFYQNEMVIWFAYFLTKDLVNSRSRPTFLSTFLILQIKKGSDLFSLNYNLHFGVILFFLPLRQSFKI